MAPLRPEVAVEFPLSAHHHRYRRWVVALVPRGISKRQALVPRSSRRAVVDRRRPPALIPVEVAPRVMVVLPTLTLSRTRPAAAAEPVGMGTTVPGLNVASESEAAADRVSPPTSPALPSTTEVAAVAPYMELSRAQGATSRVTFGEPLVRVASEEAQQERLLPP